MHDKIMKEFQILKSKVSNVIINSHNNISINL